GGGNDCCIVATVASGSAISVEVALLRAVRDGLLRKSEVGYAFFETLHHDYYSFSPQVCTLMAGRPGLPAFVLDGFVRPLVYVLGLIVEYVLHGATAKTLAGRFATDHTDREEAASRLQNLLRAGRVLAGD